MKTFKLILVIILGLLVFSLANQLLRLNSPLAATIAATFIVLYVLKKLA